VAWLYYRTVLGFGDGLGPAERAIRLGPHLLALAGIAASLALVGLWHVALPFRVSCPLVLGLTSLPVVSSGSYYGHGRTWHAVLVLFLASALAPPALLPARAVT